MVENSDMRSIKVVVTVIADGDNFETNEKDGEASTHVSTVVVDDNISLYRAGLACRKIADTVGEGLND